jgi:nicotinamide riboside kinase
VFVVEPQVDYFRDDLLRMERQNRSKESFENEQKLEKLLEKARDQFHESQFRINFFDI